MTKNREEKDRDDTIENSSEIAEKKRKLIFTNLLITCIATSFLATALSTALPPIIKDFHISVATGQWLTSGYSLAMGIMMPLTAFLIKRISTRKLYLIALFSFLMGLIVSIIADNFYIMMIGRIMQACSNGIAISMAQVVLLSIYPPEKSGTVMGWYGLSVCAAPIIAPTIAGVLVDHIGWRMVFIIPLVILSVAFIYALIVFPNCLKTAKHKFDVVSFSLSATAFSGITLGIGNIASLGIMNVKTILSLLIGILGTILFSKRQLRLEKPFLDIRLFQNKNFTLSVVGSMGLYLVMMGSSVIMPIYVQMIMGYSATISGLVILPGAVVTAVISPIAGKIYDKVGIRVLAICGMVGMSLSAIGMAFISQNTPLAVASGLNVVRSISMGLLLMPLVTWGISNVDREHTADGTAILSSLRTIAGSIGIATFVGIMNTVLEISKNTQGANAEMHGLNISFLIMGILSMAMCLAAVIFVRDNRSC